MGRPAKKESEKRKLGGARFDPDKLAELQDYAAREGRSLGAEIERRTLATMGLDERGLVLVEKIAKEIAEIESDFATGGRWHETLDTWAATVHTFRTGPIMDFRPSEEENDPEYQEVSRERHELAKARLELIETVAHDFGLTWSDAPRKPNALAALGPKSIFGSASSQIDTRAAERRAIESLPDSGTKQTLLEAHQKLEALDEQLSDVHLNFSEVSGPYAAAVKDGRMRNRLRQKRNAERARANGDPFDWSHFTGRDPWAITALEEITWPAASKD